MGDNDKILPELVYAIDSVYSIRFPHNFEHLILK